MRIADIVQRRFRHPTDRSRDSDGHAHPGPVTQTSSALLSVRAEDGTEGFILCGAHDVPDDLLDGLIRPLLVGRDAWRREAIWQTLYKRQRGAGGRFTDKALAAVDLALHDLCGKLAGLPVWRLLGGARDRIPAYASTMCGDDLPGGLATPQDYARFAQTLVARGYRAIKLHTWMPPLKGAPDVRADYAACAAVREAVGPDIALMLDPNHWYSRQDTLWLGLRLQELGFAWMEEPMEEASLSAYRWLNDRLSLPILGPETMAGKHFTRAEWAAAGACDMLRTGVWDVGGLTPSLKVAHLAESFWMSCEIHGGGAGNLALAGAIANTTWYERGLLHPFLDHETPPPHLRRIDDEMDADGFVALRDSPGLGQDVDLDYVADNQLWTASPGLAGASGV